MRRCKQDRFHGKGIRFGTFSRFPSGPGTGDDPGVDAGKTREHRLELLKTLSAMRDPQARWQWLVDRARTLPALPDAFRTEAHRVAGCQVRLWWVQERVDGRCWFRSDSDALTLKALTGLLAECYSGETGAEILAHPPLFLAELGLLRQVAESRRATLLRVVDQMRDFATSAKTSG